MWRAMKTEQSRCPGFERSQHLAGNTSLLRHDGLTAREPAELIEVERADVPGVACKAVSDGRAGLGGSDGSLGQRHRLVGRSLVARQAVRPAAGREHSRALHRRPLAVRSHTRVPSAQRRGPPPGGYASPSELVIHRLVGAVGQGGGVRRRTWYLVTVTSCSHLPPTTADAGVNPSVSDSMTAAITNAPPNLVVTQTVE